MTCLRKPTSSPLCLMVPQTAALQKWRLFIAGTGSIQTSMHNNVNHMISCHVFRIVVDGHVRDILVGLEDLHHANADWSTCCIEQCNDWSDG